jgi:hypothetical protein
LIFFIYYFLATSEIVQMRPAIQDEAADDADDEDNA